MNLPLKYHGGKHYLARQIVSLMPWHIHYVEPYAGGLAVLFAKSYAGISEVINDLNGHLMNFWRVLQDKESFADFTRQIEAVPFSEIEWQEAHIHLAKLDSVNGTNRIQRAVWFFIQCRQSMAGRCQEFTPLTRNRTRRGMNEQASAWLKAVEGLPAVHARLQRVVILNRPALEVIRSQDGPATLFYLDPPYLPQTRSAGDVYGPFEMTEADHVQLLDVILALQGKVLLSGYRCPLYDSRLAHWQRHEFNLPNHAASGIIKRRMIETLWCNFRLRSDKEVA